jgi:hypothetical protein
MRNSSILAAMLLAFGALVVIGSSSFSSPPMATPTQTPTLLQALALASPTPRPAVAEVAPHEGPPSSTPTPKEPAWTYCVIPGDTLMGIAAKFNVPVNQQVAWIQETMRLNGMVDAAHLMSGQELMLAPLGYLVVLPPIQKPLDTSSTQASLRPTPRPPAPKTPSPTATPRKTPSRPGTPTKTLTPRPATIQKSPSR